MSSTLPAGAILAGGRSRRLGGNPKALLPLAGQPMLQHVIDRAMPQVSRLLLVLERADERYRPFGLERVEDPEPGSHGPLGGLLSAMRAVSPSNEWLLLMPCDAPFLPRNLGESLLAHAHQGNAAASLIRQHGQWHPTFSAWHRSLLPDLERAVTVKGMGGLQRFLREIQPAVLDWPQKGVGSNLDPFFNINDAAALNQAEQWLTQGEQD